MKETMKSGRGKSTARKPLVDISNEGKSSTICKKKKAVDAGDGDLDRLLLARSDLSNLFNEIDGLVVQALNLEVTSRTGGQDIESLRQVLSDMHSSLKPWVSKLQKAFQADEDTDPIDGANGGGGDDDPHDKAEPELDIVSHSPLVSWRAGACTVKGGKRQLFQLTPLPKPKAVTARIPTLSTHELSRPSIPKTPSTNLAKSKCCKSELVPLSKSTKAASPKLYPVLDQIPEYSQHEKRDINKPLILKIPSAELTEAKCAKSERRTRSKFTKAASPKSYAVLDSISESSQPDNRDINKPLILKTPSTANLAKAKCRKSDHGLLSKGTSRNSHPLLNPNSKSLHNNRDINISFISKVEPESAKSEHGPPLKCSKAASRKSYPVLDPITESSQPDYTDINKQTREENTVEASNNLNSGESSVSLASRYSIPPKNNFEETLDWFLSPPKTCTLMESSYEEKPHPAGLLATSMETGIESTVRRGKQAGESTLKRELWVRFDAASKDGMHIGASVFPKTARKGFLDMLEEVSAETVE